MLSVSLSLQNEHSHLLTSEKESHELINKDLRGNGLSWEMKMLRMLFNSKNGFTLNFRPVLTFLAWLRCIKGRDQTSQCSLVFVCMRKRDEPFWSGFWQEQSPLVDLGNGGTGWGLLSADPFPAVHSLYERSPATGERRQCIAVCLRKWLDWNNSTKKTTKMSLRKNVTESNTF